MFCIMEYPGKLKGMTKTALSKKLHQILTVSSKAFSMNVR